MFGLTLLYPLGMLGLLAIPGIVGLHIFRAQRRTIIIGGLHLWDFAKRRQPVGRTRRMLENSIPLILEILAVLIITSMLSGLTWQGSPELPHALVVLDGSISMNATDAGGRSSVEKARRWISSNGGDRVRWTIVEAGVRPTLLAGPRATSAEVRDRLTSWHPTAPSAAMFESTELLARFGQIGQKMIVLTDGGAQSFIPDIPLEVQEFGTPSYNSAIAFADRYHVDATTDRIVAQIIYYGAPGTVGDVGVTVKIGGVTAQARSVRVEADRQARVEWDLATRTEVVEVQLDDDPLPDDNKAILPPVADREVVAYIGTKEQWTQPIVRALASLDDVRMVDDRTMAHLLITDRETSAGLIAPVADSQRLRTELRLPVPLPNEDTQTVTRGLWANRRHPLVRSLVVEGILWSYVPSILSTPPPNGVTLISATTETRETIPLLIGMDSRPASLRGASDLRRAWILNAQPESGNLTRSVAWPVLMMNIVEDTRQRLPGPSRSHYRVGELVTLRGDERPEGHAEAPLLWLVGPGRRQEVQEAGLYLDDLPPGYYVVTTLPDDPRIGWPFAVNVLGTEESDTRLLRDLKAANWYEAIKIPAARVDDGPFASYYLLIALAVLVGSIYLFALRRQNSP